MPSYSYRCLHCQTQEWRIAGLDDHLAICTVCGHAMAREDDDLFAPYFEGTSHQKDERPMRRPGRSKQRRKK
ncbi:MAG: hypothetical protein ACUVRZ_00765 [Desulfobacca sp.]|uniref:hypothetical protein n=1 Tax=Desulfobacca sp. TaxID=2067990 RepID=UPI0040490AD5